MVSCLQGINGAIGLDGSAPLQAFPSLKIIYESGSGVYGLGNRGLGNHGLVLEANQEYEGYFLAIGQPGTTVDIAVRFVDTITGDVLASQTLPFTAGAGTPGYGAWAQVNFTLTPTASTTCVGIEPNSDPTVECGNLPDESFLCVKCNGEFQIGLSGPGQVNLIYVFLQPGQWGRLPGLPVLKQTVQWLQDIGVTAIRQGGSFTQGAYYEWKNWIGPSPLRPSLGAQWGASLVSGAFTVVIVSMVWIGFPRFVVRVLEESCGLIRVSVCQDSYLPVIFRSLSLEYASASVCQHDCDAVCGPGAGWGPIEMANMCEAMNFSTILTTSSLSSAQDFADLVSYLFADASNNDWAAARARDGHPQPYNKSGHWFFELGNEQDNLNFPAQVRTCRRLFVTVAFMYSVSIWTE